MVEFNFYQKTVMNETFNKLKSINNFLSDSI